MSDARTGHPEWRLPLTPRELEFCLLYAAGHSLKSIAITTVTTLSNVERTLHRAKVKYRNIWIERIRA